ncbi:hypothetical protein [Rhizobium johnstonii]|uniref:hypothetical protein n=1 Tax=Rhizobium johnstonii TaxID=3019933 RepID=UPI002E104AD1|nr:hypothetical protein U8P77_27675 [Rhizobium johnstonii]
MSESDVDQFIKFFARHFVAICLVFRLKDDVGADRFFAASGAFIKIGEIYGILTAGHVINYLKEAVSDERLIKADCYLADTFGPVKLSDIGVPYSLKDAPYLDFDLKGLDFGVLFLNDNQVRLIEKHAIVPITYDASVNEPSDLDRFWIMGLPAELTSKRVSDIGHGTVGLGIVALKKLQEDERFEGNFPRFKGEIIGDLGVESIEGMSGGPIFGICSDRPEKYWIVAIQSSWLQSQRIVYGCPIPVIVDILQGLHDDSIAELEAKGFSRESGATREME